ncbi:MAG: ParB/RepB/Spo0J family partition protein [Chloroflexota bacterium]
MTTSTARKESLADILKRRSGNDSTEQATRTARVSAIQASLQAVTRGASGQVVDVPLEQLQPNPFQPRFHFQRRPLEELAESLATEGQIEPVIARRVMRSGVEVLEIVAGARRVEAARICNATIKPFPTLRADIRDLTDEEAERLSLIENLQRENLTPLEEGYRYWQLQQRDPRQWSVRAIADFVHKKKSTVQNRLGLVREPVIAEAILREQIPPTAGFHILRLNAAEREDYVLGAVSQNLTFEQIKVDIDRRLAAQRAAVARLDDRGAAGTSIPAPEGYRREVLLEERREVAGRIEERERELRGLHQRLREIDHQLAVPSG